MRRRVGTFPEGQSIALREIWDGRVWAARPFRVVSDTDDLLACWTDRGAVTKVPADLDGNRIRIQRPDFQLVDGVWRSVPTLRLARPGAAHSILLFWEGEEFQAWYVNLERPLQRTSLGFDYLDQKLDVIVWPDGRVEWKDEDELEEAVRLGIFSREEAAAVRAEAERVLDDWPFPTGWEDWRRPPLEPPELPAGWETP